MENYFDTFFREQRHIFGICPNPDCRHISRLADIRVSYRAKYVKDWLDKVDDTVTSWEGKKEELEAHQKEIRAKSIEKARRIILPQKLKSVSPLFEKPGVQPEDIKVLSHPLDFIAFDGLISNEVLRRIVLLDSRVNQRFRREIQDSIRRVIDYGKYDWGVLRVDEEGTVTQE